jgi:hypothetical protein
MEGSDETREYGESGAFFVELVNDLGGIEHGEGGAATAVSAVPPRRSETSWPCDDRKPSSRHEGQAKTTQTSQKILLR